MDIETYQDNFKQLGCYQRSRISRIPKEISAGEGEAAMVVSARGTVDVELRD